MAKITGKRIYGNLVCKILLTVAVFWGVLIAARLPSTIYDSFFRYKDLVGLAAVGFVSHMVLANFQKKAFVCWLLMLLFYGTPAYLKLRVGIPLTMDEVTDTYCFATILYTLLGSGFLLSGRIPYPRLKTAAKIILQLAAFLIVLFPLLLIGYYFMSGHLMTTSIVLTIFQTNLHEAKAYLENNNPTLWVGAVLLCLFVITGYLHFLQHMAAASSEQKWNHKWLAFFLLLLLVSGGKGIAKVRYEAVTSLFSQTKQSLAQYNAYTAAKKQRAENLEKLQNLSVDPRKKGVFVLVIGESATRDHMHAYGYQRETTPWLDQALKKPENLLFTRAYSNHTHTVPVLTYALTERNQYNQIPLEKAYSIIEVAKAAGYKTYWLSNQIKYGVYDTPIAAIASSADEEIWINGNSGKTTWTDHFDGELAERLKTIDLDQGKNALIVIHLMGSHADYQERYPKKQEKFPVKEKKNRRINSYDNTVVYTDSVLHEIYDIMQGKPNFQGMVYFSDHGEDMQNSHEVTKFTWTMAHISFVVFLSPVYCQKNPGTFQNLMNHRDQVWSNDLLYEGMLDLMGIQNMPGFQEKRDIASAQYSLSLSDGRTCHGEKKLNEDPENNLSAEK